MPLLGMHEGGERLLKELELESASEEVTSEMDNLSV